MQNDSPFSLISLDLVTAAAASHAVEAPCFHVDKDMVSFWSLSILMENLRNTGSLGENNLAQLCIADMSQQYSLLFCKLCDDDDDGALREQNNRIAGLLAIQAVQRDQARIASAVTRRPAQLPKSVLWNLPTFPSSQPNHQGKRAGTSTVS